MLEGKSLPGFAMIYNRHFRRLKKAVVSLYLSCFHGTRFTNRVPVIPRDLIVSRCVFERIISWLLVSSEEMRKRLVN
jgi:hypothetical protein